MADDANTSPNLAAASHPAEEFDDTALDESGEKLSQMRDRWLRAEAEMANVRSRAQRDVEDARQFAVQAFAKDVVEAAENLQRGIASLPAPTERESEMVTRLRDGFGGIERSFVSMLERHAILRTDPTGTAFDSNIHQAMDQQVSADHPPGTVLQAWTSA
ncbi:MAG: nucleotide exchange factor GrpE [Janthinobacterium lividum]